MPDHLKPYEWKAGESGNPAGRPPGDPILKEIQKLTKEEVKKVGDIILSGDLGELERIKNNETKGVSNLQRMIASVVIRTINKGDFMALDMILNRLIGKVKDEIQVDDVRSRITINIPDNGRDK